MEKQIGFSITKYTVLERKKGMVKIGCMITDQQITIAMNGKEVEVDLVQEYFEYYVQNHVIHRILHRKKMRREKEYARRRHKITTIMMEIHFFW